MSASEVAEVKKHAASTVKVDTSMKSDEDVTEGSYADVTAGSQSLHRSLRGPEVQLFAIGGAIGTCKSRPGDDHTLSPVSIGNVDGQWLTVIAALYVQMGSALPKRRACWPLHRVRHLGRCHVGCE